MFILLQNTTITYKKDQPLKVTTDIKSRDQCDQDLLYLDYPGLLKSVRVGSTILIADGILMLKVTDINADHLMATVLSNANIGSQKNCNLPGAIVDLPAVSERDKGDLRFGVEMKVSIVIDLVSGLVGWLVGLLVGWLVGWFVGWLVG